MSKNDDIKRMFDARKPPNHTYHISEVDIAHLPEIVQRYLKWSGVIGKKPVESVRLKQANSFMYLKPDSKGLPTSADQYFTVNPPAFLWYANVKMPPLAWFSGRDEYKDGHGHMLIKLFNLLPIVNGKGAEIDQGTLARFMAEIIWFPSAWLSDYITWEAVDETTARMTITYGGYSVTGTMTFDEEGRPLEFAAKRHMDGGGRKGYYPWGAHVTGYREFEGMRVISKGQVYWQLEEGEWIYYDYEVTDIQYDCPEPY